MRTSDLRARLRSGAGTLGTWLTLGNSGIAEIMARAGFDWVVVDLEHSVIDLATAGELIRTIDLCGCCPLVRLTSNDADQAKRVLDAGAHGIVVPMVNCRADAERAVRATRYAPLGVRGVGLARAQAYGPGFQDYLAWQADGPLVVVQIEHRDALANLREILTTPGVDAFIIGPYDLSCSLGIPGQFAHPDFLAAMADIRAVGAELGVPGGLHVVEPDPAALRRCVADGYRFIAYSVDIRVLDAGLRSGVHSLKGVNR